MTYEHKFRDAQEWYDRRQPREYWEPDENEDNAEDDDDDDDDDYDDLPNFNGDNGYGLV